jgi:hypothetical protein
MSEVQGKHEGPIRNRHKPSLTNKLHQGKIDVEIVCKETQTQPAVKGHRARAPDRCIAEVTQVVDHVFSARRGEQRNREQGR